MQTVLRQGNGIVRAIEEWLNGLGLDKYSQVFAENDVDLRALPHLKDVALLQLATR
jgi:hypothetical protein